MVVDLRGNFLRQAIDIELNITRIRAVGAIANYKYGKVTEILFKMRQI